MDDIKQKLALIDKKLAGGFINSYMRVSITSPLLFAAVGLIIGILIQHIFFQSPVTSVEPRVVWFWLVLLIASAVSAILLFVTQRKGRLDSYAPVLLSTCALICFICLGAIRLITFHHLRPNDISNFVADDQKLAIIRGSIISQPYINRNENWRFARYKLTDPTTSFYLRIKQIQTTDGWTKVTGTVRVQVDELVLDLKAGDYIQAYCWLDRFEPATNPGQFDIAEYLARKNVYVAASVKLRDGIELLERGSTGALTKVKGKITELATQALLGGPFPEDQSEGLLQALLLGYRANIDSATYHAFRKTGLLHFISLSGMHLGIFIGIVWWLCKAVGLMKRSRAIVCIIAIAIFLLIVPPRAPTVQAAIIGWVFCLSILFRRHSNSINTLALAAIILLLLRPTHLFEVGWQLSFASVLGIILFADRIHFFMYEKITSNFWFQQKPKDKLFSRIISKLWLYILRLFSVGLAAWLGGAGILLYHFYAINPLTSIWTVIVFPFIAGILIIGYLKIVISFLLPTLAEVLGVVVTGFAALLIGIVKFIAHLDMSQVLIGHVPVTIVILYYAFIFFVAYVYFQRPLLKKVISTAMLLIIIVFLGITKSQRTYRGNLVITCLDVGHGQAILAQLPGKANVIFDCGSLYKSDIGRRIVAPFLDYSGIDKIDAIVISHSDIDHINGIPETVEHCKVEAIFANDVFFDEAGKGSTAKFLKDELLKMGHKIQHLNTKLGSTANITILWPDKKIPQYEQLSDNDKSQVLLVEFAGRKMLLCADIEKFAQRELLRIYPDLKANVVVVPHHGSTRTAEPDFLDNLSADILICSCGRGDYASSRTINLESKAKWLCTAEHGAVIVCIDKDGMIR